MPRSGFQWCLGREFAQVIELIGRVKADYNLPKNLKLVLITNGSLVNRPGVQAGVIMLVIAAALAGMISGLFVSGCAVGLLLAAAYGRAKSGKHPAYALHLVYWDLPAPVTGLTRAPPSYLREMVG